MEVLSTLRDHKDAYIAAREITTTITQNLLKNAPEGLILAHNISLEVARTLKHFDRQAWLRYSAEHPSLHI